MCAQPFFSSVKELSEHGTEAILVQAGVPVRLAYEVLYKAQVITCMSTCCACVAVPVLYCTCFDIELVSVFERIRWNPLPACGRGGVDGCTSATSVVGFNAKLKPLVTRGVSLLWSLASFLVSLSL